MNKTAIFLIIVFLISITGCNDKEMGIFYSVEQERKVDDNTLVNNATIGNIIVVNDDYYVAAGDVYKVNADSNFLYHTAGTSAGKWKVDSTTPSGMSCYSLIKFGTEIYGVFYDRNETSETTVNKDLYENNGTDWEKVTFSEPELGRIEMIIEDNSLAFLLSYTLDSSNTRTYYIHSYDGTNATQLVSGLSASTRFDVAFDGTDYWLIYGFELYSGTGISMAKISSGTEYDTIFGTTLTDSDRLQGIYYSNLYNALFLSKKDGAIVYRPDGGSWTMLDQNLSNIPEDFVDFTDSDGTQLLLIGTSNGYYEKNITADIGADFISPTDTIGGNSYQTLDLKSAVISSLFTNSLSNGEEILFALTQNNGLWSNGVYSDGIRVWDLE